MVRQIISVEDYRFECWLRCSESKSHRNVSDLTKEGVKWLNDLILQILGYDFKTSFRLMQGRRNVWAVSETYKTHCPLLCTQNSHQESMETLVLVGKTGTTHLQRRRKGAVMSVRKGCLLHPASGNMWKHGLPPFFKFVLRTRSINVCSCQNAHAEAPLILNRKHGDAAMTRTFRHIV